MQKVVEFNYDQLWENPNIIADKEDYENACFYSDVMWSQITSRNEKVYFEPNTIVQHICRYRDEHCMAACEGLWWKLIQYSYKSILF